MIGATNVQPGPRMAGAFIRNVQVRLDSPDAGATVTSPTPALQATNLDPFRRSGYVVFQLDRVANFATDLLQTSANIAVLGWADVPANWAAASIGNGLWTWRARSTGVKVGAGPAIPNGRWAGVRTFVESGGTAVRSLYLYVNKAMPDFAAGVGSNARSLYLYVDRSMYEDVIGVEARSLYLYVDQSMYEDVIFAGFARSLYLFLTRKDGEVFPWLNHLSPTEQYEGGQVDLYGDGFGQYLDAQETETPVVTVSSTNGGNIGLYAIDRTALEWQSTSGASAWIRFTWTNPKRIVAIVLEGSANGTFWGKPRFTFDDATSQDGTVDVPAASTFAQDSQIPVGSQRQVYWLATPKDTTYVQVSNAPTSGSGTNRGFSEVWIVEEIIPNQDAEPSRAWLNLDYIYAQDMGIVDWKNRSPNFYPANSGTPILPAATVTVPVGAVSGLVKVQEGA
jgi:hypothetical protein